MIFTLSGDGMILRYRLDTSHKHIKGFPTSDLALSNSGYHLNGGLLVEDSKLKREILPLPQLSQ